MLTCDGQHISSVHRSSAHRPGSISLLFCSHSWLRLALHKNCQKRRCTVPRRMVPLSVRNVRSLQLAYHQSVYRLSSIGDWYPERNIFQILIALTSGKCSDLCDVRPTHIHLRSPLRTCISAVLPPPLCRFLLSNCCISIRHYTHVVLRRLGLHHV